MSLVPDRIGGPDLGAFLQVTGSCEKGYKGGGFSRSNSGMLVGGYSCLRQLNAIVESSYRRRLGWPLWMMGHATCGESIAEIRWGSRFGLVTFGKRPVVKSSPEGGLVGAFVSALWRQKETTYLLLSVGSIHTHDWSRFEFLGSIVSL